MADDVRAGDVRVPRLLYGTAWKEDRTGALVHEALAAGFRGIDTANQRKHYHAAAVGAAVQDALRAGLRREDLFLQTKFTFRAGQDHRLPYASDARVPDQVAQSMGSSLQHLGTSYVDAYLLHGPSRHHGLGDEDWEAWHAIEALRRHGKARAIGVSNVDAGQLQAFIEGASTKPALVQNRCFTRPQADADVRQLCDEHGILYEGFSLLTGHALVRHPVALAAASRMGCSPAQAVFRYCLDRDIIVLTGTTSRQHMEQDLAVASFRLDDADAQAMDRVLGWPRPT